MRWLALGLTLLLLVLLTACRAAPPPATPTPAEATLQAPELNLAAELEASEPLISDLGEMDADGLELLPDLVSSVEVETDVSPPLASFDLSLPAPE